MRQITDKAREFGAGPLFNQILPLLMSPTLEDQERHLLVKVIDRILYKLDDLVRPYVHKVCCSLLIFDWLFLITVGEAYGSFAERKGRQYYGFVFLRSYWLLYFLQLNFKLLQCNQSVNITTSGHNVKRIHAHLREGRKFYLM